MKKITIRILLIALLLLALMAMPVLASTGAAVKLSDATVSMDGTATMTLSLENFPEVDAIGVQFHNIEPLTMDNSSQWMINVDNDFPDVDAPNAAAVWVTENAVTVNGEVLQLRFNVPQIADGENEPQLEYIVECTVVVQRDNKELYNKKISGKISVEVPATELTLDQKSAKLHLNHDAMKEAQLQAVLTPAYATDAVTWSSSAEDIAAVSETGIVTAVNGGVATVTATAASGVEDSCTVTVCAGNYIPDFTPSADANVPVFITYTCDNCDDSYREGFHSADIVLDPVLGVRFYTENYSGTVKIQVGDNGQAMDIQPSESPAPGYWVYQIDVFAQDMTKPITATIYGADEQPQFSKTVYLAEYVNSIQQSEDQPQKVKALAQAMYTYCQYAAKLKGNYDGPTNKVDPVPESVFAENVFVTSSDARGISLHAYLESACQLRMRLSADYAEHTVLVDGKEVVLVSSDNGFLVSTEQIKPQDYAVDHTFVIKQGETEVYSGSFSVLDYLCRCIDRSIGNEDQLGLMTAMYHYYAAAKASVTAE